MKDKNQNHIVEPNKKVSSVEWLFDQINDALIDFIEGKISASLYGIRVTEYKQQAKQMHKDEIKNAWAIDRQFVFYDSDKDELSDDKIDELTEQYYNETFQ